MWLHKNKNIQCDACCNIFLFVCLYALPLPWVLGRCVYFLSRACFHLHVSEQPQGSQSISLPLHVCCSLLAALLCLTELWLAATVTGVAQCVILASSSNPPPPQRWKSRWHERCQTRRWQKLKMFTASVADIYFLTFCQAHTFCHVHIPIHINISMLVTHWMTL